jgi:ABC-2 type transport system ATP-binding protein
MYSIEVKNLTKKFGNFISVDNISFEVNEGEVFGFLGANGAGKSTTIKMLCGMIEATSGEATVSGFSINKQPEMIKKVIGYMSQKFSLYNDLTVKENINFFGGIYGLENDLLKERKKWVLNISGLEGKDNKLTKNLSTGFKQRLALGCAVIHEPKVVFLDEPTGGVDPISRRTFWDLINSLSQKGITVFVTTHYLDEAEFCNRIMMIDAGKIIAGGSPKELKEKYLDKTILEVETEDLERTLNILDGIDWIVNASFFGKYIHAATPKSDNTGYNLDEKSQMIRTKLEENGVEVKRIDIILPSLEDVFVNLLEPEGSKNAV